MLVPVKLLRFFTKFSAWQRFYFDPPEFQTLFISNKDTFHLGYYRVAPDQMPAFVVGNEGTNKIVTSEGSNLLAAFKNYIWMKQRESSRTGASNLKKVYDEIAKERGITIFRYNSIIMREI